jgi:hypothetical protein
VTTVDMDPDPAPDLSASNEAERRFGLFRRPPRLLFHGILVATGLVVLWAFSFPGVHFLVVVPCIWVIAGSALVWVVRGATYVRSRRQGSHAGSTWWFAVAPVGALLLAAVLHANAPLRARWQVSKSDFEATLRAVRAEPDAWSRWHERRIGTHKITYVQVVDRGVIFHDSVGALFDDAGFAYLPEGHSPDMANGSFEDPQWFALGDHWYAWTASW